MDIKSAIDLHVHIGPETFPRKFTVPKIIEEEKGKIKVMVLKNHFYPTIPLIKTVDETDLKLIGSLTLNNYVGGLNPNAVYASAKLSERPIVVWFPTISASNFLDKSEYEIRPEWAAKGFRPRASKDVIGIRISKKSKLTKEAEIVLKEIANNACILATGHISWEEAKLVTEKALDIGISKIVVTHPIYQLIDMPIEIQKELSKNKGVYIEHNYAMFLIDKVPITKIAKQIKDVGAKKCILSSDMGQIKSPNPSEALRIFSNLLKKEGISEDDIEKMLIRNPNKIVSR